MNERPSSLVHYTSLSTLYEILYNATRTGKLTFHLSHLLMMNDANEGKLIYNKYFSGSDLKNNRKKDFEIYLSDKDPFVMSLSKTNKFTKNYGIIPMWKMYGDNFYGCQLRFKYDDLEKHIESLEGNLKIKLGKCNYATSERISNITKELNATLNNQTQDNYTLLCKAAYTKFHTWDYEDEWRIVVLEKKENVRYKFSANREIKYIRFDIPITCLKEIMLGPLTNNETKSIFDKLVSKLNTDHKIQFTKSKIAIQ